MKIRQPAVAGLFYPGRKIDLDREVAMYLEEAPEDVLEGRIVGMVCPHAGYMYSGGVAARAYRHLIGNDIDVVAVISPSHREYFTEISVYDGYAYVTPLGSIPVARRLADQLAAYDPLIILSEKGHRYEEHALEVQLPLLQKVLNRFELIPVVMGEHGAEHVDVLSAALAEVLRDKRSLIVASSDLSHFYHADRAKVLDHQVVEDIESFDENKLLGDIQSGACEMCGGGPTAAVMKACKRMGADISKVLLYRHSGNITGDNNEVVGYLSALFIKSGNN